jgi:hypothetical protein
MGLLQEGYSHELQRLWLARCYGAASRRLLSWTTTPMTGTLLWGCFKKATLMNSNAYDWHVVMGLLQEGYSHELQRLWLERWYGAATGRLFSRTPTPMTGTYIWGCCKRLLSRMTTPMTRTLFMVQFQEGYAPGRQRLWLERWLWCSFKNATLTNDNAYFSP